MPEPAVSTTISGGAFQGVVGAGTVHIENLIFNNNYAPSDALPMTAVSGADDTIPECPYPGLSYFGPDEADFFFGRETTVERLAHAVRRQSFVSVVGASGCGKSSVVLAGLAPFLHRDGEWNFSYFRIGTELDHDPFVALARILVPLYVDTPDATERLVNTRKLSGLLKTGALSLPDVFSEVRSRNKGRRILLIADQFEEVFSTVDDEAVRRQFIDALLEPFRNQPSGRDPDICLTLTLRADFYGRALEYRPLADLLQDRVENVGPMNRLELDAAIRQPAAKRGVSFEPGLGETLLDRVEKEPGALPLLQFALRELWKRQLRRTLIRRAYDEIGGVEGALAKRAEDIFYRETERASGSERVFQRLFTRLVAPGDGHLDTRRVVPRSELGDDAWALAQRLADEENRLIVVSAPQSDRETAELAHEALIEHWPRLSAWLAHDRAFRSWLQDTRRAAERWAVDPSDDGPLLRGGILVRATEWLAARTNDLSARETAFVRASIALKQAQDDREAAERERELRVQTELAESAERARVEAERRTAVEVRARQQSVARQLSTSALNQVSADYSAALLLAIEATIVDNTLDARATLFDVARRHPHISAYLRAPSPGRYTGARIPQNPAVAFSPDGRLAVAIDRIGGSEVHLWEVASSRRLAATLAGHDSTITSLAFSRDGRLLATGALNGVVLWDLVSSQQIAHFQFTDLGEALMAETVAFDATASRVAVGTNDRADRQACIRIWDVATQAVVSTLMVAGRENYGVTGFGVSRLVFAADGTSIIAGVQPFKDFRVGRRMLIPRPGGGPLPAHAPPDDGFVAFLDIATGQSTAEHWDGGAVAISPDGETILTRNGGGEISLIYPSARQRHPLSVSADWGLGSFSSDGKYLCLGTGPELSEIDFVESCLNNARHPATDCHITSVAVSPDGTRVLSCDSDDAVIMWTLQAARSMGSLLGDIPGGTGVPPTASLFSPDGEHLILSKGFSRELIRWSLDKAQPDTMTTFPGTGKEPSIAALAQHLSAGGVAALAMLDDGTVYRFDPMGADGASVVVAEHGTAVAGARRAAHWAVGRSTGEIELHTGAEEPGTPSAAVLSLGAPVMALAIDCAGTRVAACGPTGRVVVFETTTLWQATELFALELGGSDRLALHFSPDGDQLLGLGAGQAVLWDLSTVGITGRYASLNQMYGAPMVGAFSPVDALFALASPFEPGIRLIRSDLMEPYAAPLTLYIGGTTAGGIAGLTFSHDGTRLAAAYSNDELVIWDMSSQRARREACQVANRDLTRDEWTRYLPTENYRSTCFGSC